MAGELIAKMRKLRGYSQKQIALKLGVSQGTISQWENDISTPPADQIVKLAKILGVSVEELMGQEPSVDESWALRERLRRDPDYRMLFDAADRASPEHLRAAAAMLKALEGVKDD